jgi:uncharacterized protein CbrC (UPF0167 family)
MRTKLVAEQRCELIRRVADWVYDNTESWEPDNIGLGLAYLFWAIADSADAAPFDATFDGTGDFYEELLGILDSNPNGLLKELIDGGFILVDSKSVRRRLKAQKGKR